MPDPRDREGLSSYGDHSVRPPDAEHQADLLGWATEAMQEGEDFLRRQPGFEKIDDTIRAILSHQDPAGTTSGTAIPGPLSRSDVNQFGKIALDLRSGLTDTKIFWEYSTNNHRYDKHAEMATKRGRSWWLTRQCDMRLADGISWCFAAGSAAMRLVYSREAGDQEFQAIDPRDALPIRPNDYLDYDSGLAVLLRREVSVNYLRALYAGKRAYPGGPRITADMIRADKDGSYGRISSMIASVASPLLRGLALDRDRARTKLGVPSCDLWTIQVKDDSLNEGSQAVLMGPHDSTGKPTANWSYAVEPGEPLYPRGRVIVMTRTVILYDGPSIYWHGKFDTQKLTLDAWPFSWLGKSPLWDLLPLQESLRGAVRLVDNHIKKIQRPALIADKNNISKTLYDKLDTALAGLKVYQNPSMGKGVQIIPEPPLDPTVMAYITFILERMESISGAKDVTNLAEVGQIPSSETIERLMEAMSPAIRARSRSLEAFLRPLAYKVLSNFMQFDDMRKRIRILGPDGAVLEDLDYDPGTLIPDFLHPEDLDPSGNPTPAARARGPRSRADRAQVFMGMFDFVIQPGSLLKASEISDKLLYLQLARAGWLDIQTVLEKLGIPNIPEILKRLAVQKQMEMDMQVNAAGRKASGQTMPTMRGDGKISES